jgi:ferritin-like protein
MSSESYHEPYEQLSEKTRELHRAIVSLIEELDAVDWYNQRAEVTKDAELRATLLHHRDEEIEHASMNLEWIRRNMVQFDENLRTYLFAEGPIVGIEEAATGGEHEKGSIEGPGGARARAAARPAGGSLGIGSLRGT